MLKKVITTAVLGVSVLGVMAANAAAPGAYVTGQLGYANTHMKTKTDSQDGKLGPIGSNLSNNGLAGRLALGYQFNQNFALEVGYLQLKNGRYNESGSYPWGTEKLKQNSIDLAAKVILPISDSFNIYGKLGAAYLTSNIVFKDQDSSSPYNNDNGNVLYGIAKHKWAPEAAIGVSYDITPNVSVDTSWTHIQPVGKNRPGNIDFVAVGLGYNFG